MPWYRKTCVHFEIFLPGRLFHFYDITKNFNSQCLFSSLEHAQIPTKTDSFVCRSCQNFDFHNFYLIFGSK